MTIQRLDLGIIHGGPGGTCFQGHELEGTPRALGAAATYRYYRLNFTAADSGGGIICGEFRFFSDGGFATDISPTMTSNTAPSPYVVSASHSAGSPWATWEASNNVTTVGLTDGWFANALPCWWKIDFGSAVAVLGYSVTNRLDDSGRRPTAWTLEGSNNDTDWTELDSRSGITWSSNGQTQNFAVS